MDLRERLAEQEHDRWAHWMRYMIDHCTDENIERWVEQMQKPYSDLTEAEKESDRAWADRLLEVLAEAIDEEDVE